MTGKDTQIIQELPLRGRLGDVGGLGELKFDFFFFIFS